MTEDTPQRPTYARIDLDDLAFNLRSSRQFIGKEVRCMAVVKGNAYGHGATACALRLESEGVEWFGVATLEEAIELRAGGVLGRILCLSGFYPGQEAAGLRSAITPAVFSVNAAERIDKAAAASGTIAKIHIKIDTGMGRVGMPFVECGEFADRLARLPNIEVEALMTHFAAADDLKKNEFTERQALRFAEVCSLFRDRGFRPDFVHLANSPAAVAHPSFRADMVRLGGILYGLSGDILPAGISKPELRPVLSLHTRLAQIKPVEPGSSIGYARSFIATRRSLIGTIPIGYADGFRRGLSSSGSALVNGVRVPLAGRVSMDWVTLDITDVPDAALGDEVILIGSAGKDRISAEDIAAELGTISYEVTCGLSQRVPRVYCDAGLADATKNRIR